MNQISKRDSFDVIQGEIVERKDRKSAVAPSSKWDYMTSLGKIGRLPHYERGLELREVKKANRYLAFQEERIVRSIEAGNIKKAVLIWICLIKCSRSYQVLLFNRVARGGYWKGPTAQVEEILFGAINKMRSGDMKLLINRFYILKKNGKMRPIGAPNWESRMISKALTDMVYAVTEKGRSVEQHGYMKNRGAGSAILQAVRLLKQGYSGYEFDLKSFFNTVEPFIIFRKLEEIDKRLAKLISKVIKLIEYRYDRLLPESELHPKAGRKNTLVRTGVPQGLSLSPLLSTGALEYYGRPENLVMYADDGIYFFKHNISKFTRGMEKMGRAGIEIAPEKSGSLPPVFKFCGIEVDRLRKKCSFGSSSIGWDDENELERWLRTINNDFYKKKEGTWEVNENSFITMRSLKLSKLERMGITYYSLWNGKAGKGYRKFPGINGIFDIFGSSSGSCNELLKIVKYKKGNCCTIKPFDIDKGEIVAFNYAPIPKGSYRRYYNNGKKGTIHKPIYGEIMEFHNLRRQQLRAIIE